MGISDRVFVYSLKINFDYLSNVLDGRPIPRNEGRQCKSWGQHAGLRWERHIIGRLASCAASTRREAFMRLAFQNPPQLPSPQPPPCFPSPLLLWYIITLSVGEPSKEKMVKVGILSQPASTLTLSWDKISYFFFCKALVNFDKKNFYKLVPLHMETMKRVAKYKWRLR